jgi:hypothetical protein
LKQFILRIFDMIGKALRRIDTTPQNLTAITEIIPNPEMAPKFFNQPPILGTKSEEYY